MTSVLIGKDLILSGWWSKIEVIQVLGRNGPSTAQAARETASSRSRNALHNLKVSIAVEMHGVSSVEMRWRKRQPSDAARDAKSRPRTVAARGIPKGADAKEGPPGTANPRTFPSDRRGTPGVEEHPRREEDGK